MAGVVRVPVRPHVGRAHRGVHVAVEDEAVAAAAPRQPRRHVEAVGKQPGVACSSPVDPQPSLQARQKLSADFHAALVLGQVSFVVGLQKDLDIGLLRTHRMHESLEDCYPIIICQRNDPTVAKGIADLSWDRS